MSALEELQATAQRVSCKKISQLLGVSEQYVYLLKIGKRRMTPKMETRWYSVQAMVNALPKKYNRRAEEQKVAKFGNCENCLYLLACKKTVVLLKPVACEGE